ncbi:Predicted acetyltransferase [Quadrisphaera granulorum]|uniref:Putative acetyltransferase n=1 Tax=Quadrisphaera granulorum TaxID=317664 RepID=A0A316ADG2_9ACTN|nr:GNAT family N-acetyltransferase [Quadrisphaera granulorum]PWJ55661.1 putative acetyltransferase [Quadrisphaera granulorum]SZE95158.1 Predicted acetyltransferase [Quadrisphaera granulorum]
MSTTATPLAAITAGAPVDPVIRRATRDDLPALRALDSRAFGASWPDDEFAGFEALFEAERFVVAVEPGDHAAQGIDGIDALAGTAGAYPFTMTLPGGAQLPVPGVTWVAVALHQRRRGLLRRMFADLHTGLVAEGAALAVLTASEAGIYGRFGYGAATTNRSVSIDRRCARFTPAAEALAGAAVARHASIAAAKNHLAAVHDRWCAATPGALSRSSAWWDWVLTDPPDQRSGGTELFALVHPDGYATYQVTDDGDTARVVEVVATTPAAHASLWRSLLALDLVEDVVARRAVPLDDPLPHLLTDPRAVTTTALRDGMWVRLLDVPAALAARSYACEVDVVLEVDDDGGLPGVDASARVRLRGGPDGAECTRTDTPADVRLGVGTLGAAFLGGPRLAPLARAGLVQADAPAVVARLHSALACDGEPQYSTSF